MANIKYFRPNDLQKTAKPKIVWLTGRNTVEFPKIWPQNSQSGNHAVYRAKPGSERYVIDQFVETIAEWSEYCALLDAVRKLDVVRNSIKNLR